MTVVEEFCEALGRLDSPSLIEKVEAALEGHASGPQVIDELLQPALVWVGTQWESGEWTVAQEHRATAAVAQLIARLPRTPRYDRGETVLILAAEGEWHTMPVTMLEYALTVDGFDVVALNGPIPPGHLLPLIHELGPRCVALSCVMPSNLPGTRRMARVARDAGLPIVTGGGALNSARSRMVGANAFAATVSNAGAAIDSTPRLTTPLPPLTHGAAEGFEWFEDQLHHLATRLVARCEEVGQSATTDGVLMLRSLAAGLMCDDPTILRDQMEWQHRREAHSNLSARALIGCLHEVVVEGPESVQRLMASAEAG